MKDKRTLYEVLGVPDDASIEQLTEAYRGLVKDLADDPAAFQEATSAYMRLANAEDRVRYDEELGHSRARAKPPPFAEPIPASPAPATECPSCSASCPDGVDACPYCGRILDAPEPAPQKPVAEAKPVAKPAAQPIPVAQAEPRHRLGLGKLIRLKGTGEYSFDDPVTTLGRSPTNDISIPHDRYLSNRHAKIHCELGEFYIEDLGSTNGTFVDGKRAVAGERVHLASGCKVKVGHSRFEFVVQ